ncbi:DUF6879 family protein [Streptomyces harbinensis]|uniref:DUF6879 family protein n=1 Tax=Streptomyces harbinensis TaxID=1176198 RepID=UPI0034DEAA8D
MRNLYLPTLDPSQGTWLDNPAYRRDFRERTAGIRDGGSWKLERVQHFEEPANRSPSREALRQGDWQASLRLLEDRRENLLNAWREDQRRNYVFHRVRVVEWPLTPYVQWELHSLRQQSEYGVPVRVISDEAEAVRARETRGSLPEIVTHDGSALHHVRYSTAGDPQGAYLFTDPAVVGPWEDYIKTLFEAGEDVRTYVERVVAPLPPPRLTTAGAPAEDAEQRTQ